jgi:repressor LexA
MLTRKQYELLMFIHERVREAGVPPSFDEMKDALDLKSKSGIHRLITALEERGFIRRMQHRARALEIVRLPENNPMARRGARPEPSLVETRETRPASLPSKAAMAAAMTVPMVGQIAAGTPIEALQQTGNEVGVPQDMLATGEHYALEVKGDSMINAGILNGDTVIIRRCDTASNGDVVVALVDGQEATLKRLRRKGNAVALEAANPDFETRIYNPERVKIQGKLVGLLRHY